MRTVTMAAALVLVLIAGCGDGTETRTYALQHIDADAAVAMIEPYVPGGRDAISATMQPAALTVTAPVVRLDQVEEVLRRYDRPLPDVQLRFQIIEADGFTETDPAIADVQQVLQDLFRFRGYRLVGEVVSQAKAPGRVQQQLTVSERETYTITAGLERVVVSGSERAVELGVELRLGGAPIISTSLTVPGGQTVVVGSGRARADGNMLILVVRPVIPQL